MSFTRSLKRARHSSFEANSPLTARPSPASKRFASPEHVAASSAQNMRQRRFLGKQSFHHVATQWFLHLFSNAFCGKVKEKHDRGTGRGESCGQL
jgi:hypothetical protein